MDFKEIMTFDEADMSAFAEKEEKQGNQLLYKTRVKDSKTDGEYRSKIRMLMNPKNVRESFLKKTTYWIDDENGKFTYDSSLSIGDKNCPMFCAWKNLWFSRVDSEEIKAKNKAYAKEHFNNSESIFVGIQVIEDENQPDLVGKFMYWKVPKKVYNRFYAKMNPSDVGTPKIQLLNPMTGPIIDVVVQCTDLKNPQNSTNYDLTEISTDVQSIIKTDGDLLLTDDEMAKVDSYVDLKLKVDKANCKMLTASEKMKARTTTTFNNAKKALEESGLQNDLSPVFEKIFKYLDENGVDVLAEEEYKKATPELQSRVDKFIEKVLQTDDKGNYLLLDPTKPIISSNSIVSPSPTTESKTSEVEEETTDLPF